MYLDVRMWIGVRSNVATNKVIRYYYIYINCQMFSETYSKIIKLAYSFKDILSSSFARINVSTSLPNYIVYIILFSTFEGMRMTPWNMTSI